MFIKTIIPTYVKHNLQLCKNENNKVGTFCGELKTFTSL